MGFTKELLIDDTIKSAKQFKFMLKDKLFWKIFKEVGNRQTV